MPPAARPSVRYRSIVIVVLLFAIALGFVALGRLTIDQAPSPAAPWLKLQISAPGLTAPVLETLLTRPLERLLAGTPGLADMESVTTTGSIRIDLRPPHRRGTEHFQRQVRERLEQAEAFWPASIDPPVVSLADDFMEAARFTVKSGTHGPLALRDWIEAEFARQLRELPGVDAVEIAGGAVREIVVMPDQRRLAGLGLSFEDLRLAIRKNPELTVPGRSLPAKSRSPREPVQAGNLTAVSAIPVPLPDGESVHLGEVARLSSVHQPDSSPRREAGAENIQVTVNKQASSDLLDVAARIRSHVDWMRANRVIPDGIEIDSVAGRIEMIRRSLKEARRALVTGLVLVLLMSYLLWGGRRALMLGVILLATLQGVFVTMALTGVALNSLTLGSLALGAGLFTAAATLLFERPVQAAGAAARAAIVAVSGALIAALIPVLFIDSTMNILHREFVSVLGGAWLLASFLSLWLVPVFDRPRARRELAPWCAAFNRVIDRARQSYDGLLRRLSQRIQPALIIPTLALSALMAAGFAGAWKTLGVPERPAQEILLRLQGPDRAVAAEIADSIIRQLSALPELRQISHSAQAMREELTLEMQEDRARELEVDAAVAGKALAIASTGITVGSFRDADHRYNVRMRLPPEDADDVASGKILLLGELEDRPAIHLRDVAVIGRAAVPAEIRHDGGQPVIDITARVSSPADHVTEKVKAVLEKINLPSDYPVAFGEEENRPEIQGLRILGIAALLVFLAQVLLSRSWRLALLTLSVAGTTLAGTGAVLVLFGIPFTSSTWLALIVLLGISAGHSTILMMQVGDRPALFHGLRRQFRPLVVTAGLSVLGMASLTWTSSDAFIASIPFVLIAGLLFSLSVNLFLTPLLYWWFFRPGTNSPVAASTKLS